VTAHCAKIDQFVEYTKMMKHLYGKDCPLMTRDRWDAACSKPRKVRVLNDAEFDYNYFSEECGDGSIY
jgi:hypothetical protein